MLAVMRIGGVPSICSGVAASWRAQRSATSFAPAALVIGKRIANSSPP